MNKFLCVVAALVLSGSAYAATPNGDETKLKSSLEAQGFSH